MIEYIKTLAISAIIGVPIAYTLEKIIHNIF
jgi:hypothetical protein